MVISSINENCIWCGRRLVSSSYEVNCDDNFGPRPRSDEHIIPQALFGKLITTDLCRCCNSRFGESCDHALVKDERIVGAAKRAGVSITDLWSRFEGFQHTAAGRQVRTVFKAGIFRPQSELNSLDKLAVVTTEGNTGVRDLNHLRARLITKVQATNLGLSDHEIIGEVNILLSQLETAPSESHFNAVIREGFRASELDPKVVVSTVSRPWETDWALAKIVFELSNTLVTNPYRAYFAEASQTVRTFLERRECNLEQTQGVGIFKYRGLSGDATKRHTIEGILTPHRFEWNLTFFGVSCWSYSIDATPIHAPSGGQRYVIENPTENGDASVQLEAIP